MNNEVDFSDLQVGEQFYFATRQIEGQEPYIKVEEIRRPYTPEAYSNAQRSDVVFFYVSPSSKVISKSHVPKGHAQWLSS